MPNKLDVRKTIQIIAVLLHSDRCNRMSYLRLLKLLYIAYRESLAETGRSMTNDRVVAMKHGPVLSEVYYLVESKHPANEKWGEFLRKGAYILELVGDPGTSELSPYEIRKLSEIADRCRDFDEWDMVELTHGFPECIRNRPDESQRVKVRDIPLEDILAEVGRSEDVSRIMQEDAEGAFLDQIFSR
jgi:uncharacterized phage-associated protein